MRKKELKLVITFHTTADAMAMEKACKEHGAAGRLIRFRARFLQAVDYPGAKVDRT